MDEWLLGEGDRHPVVSELKRRLGFIDCDDVVTDVLVQRVRGIQITHGFEPDGVIDDRLLEVVGLARGNV